MSSSSSSASSSSSSSSLLSIRVRPSEERGHSEHGWLNSYHTFSFADYYAPSFSSFHSLRVLNEDRVIGGKGFPTHPHKFYEIFSYVVRGALLHHDSMGNKEVINTGDIQFTSAGTGMSHSEFNASSTRSEFVHFLQMWVAPSSSKMAPHYQTRSFKDEQKKGQLCLVVSPFDDGNKETVKIHQDMKVYASMLKHDETVSTHITPGRALFVHLIQDATEYESESHSSALEVNGVSLNDGDGAFIELKEGATEKQAISFRGVNKKNDARLSHFLLFDIAQTGNNDDED